MITVIFKDCKTFSQKIYNKMLYDLPLHRIKCTCGKSACLIFYGHYSRKVKFFSVLLTILVQRVLCKECGRTHAILPSLLVPYSRIPLKDQKDILYCLETHAPVESILERNILVDENSVKYILRQFLRHWKQRLLSAGLSLTDPLDVSCIPLYQRQFMQIHRTPNTLFSPTNTA